ncbi:hypothetical protein OSB04_027257 [Centaurea solstitialis]|uniref:Reverse transcriptase Ty1/copia-type domain-containing protein n=1 Tax=Centaurea solstitialis TaxID=347529 RepID=A0AA38SRR1_9ASTR|nr:hypothetical protein OSB04_027257 [Centaurea solstitialis]
MDKGTLITRYVSTRWIRITFAWMVELGCKRVETTRELPEIDSEKTRKRLEVYRLELELELLGFLKSIFIMPKVGEGNEFFLKYGDNSKNDYLLKMVIIFLPVSLPAILNGLDNGTTPIDQPSGAAFPGRNKHIRWPKLVSINFKGNKFPTNSIWFGLIEQNLNFFYKYGAHSNILLKINVSVSSVTFSHYIITPKSSFLLQPTTRILRKRSSSSSLRTVFPATIFRQVLSGSSSTVSAVVPWEQTANLLKGITKGKSRLLTSISFMLGIANLQMHQMDVKIDLLNEDLEEIYMEQPKGFVAQGKENKVCKLVNTLYGLKQAPKQ